jgi:ubiquinone/menaquinone biosynthesis C-methylase UbiE
VPDRAESEGTTDPKRLVAEGYDLIADTHADWATRTRVGERERYAAVLLESLPVGARVLELGCGTGVPTTAALAARFRVTGVDISARHVELARHRVPGAEFLHADMTELEFPDRSFDAVAAFYSIIHVPRREQAGLLRSIARWLKPGGLLVATMGALGDPDDSGSVETDWLGAPMYWSTFDAETNRALVSTAGLEIVSATEETEDEDGDAVTFLWVVARKP